MEWKSAEPKPENAILIPDRWLFLHYYEALNILFRSENGLRVFVYVVLKNKFKEKWAETTVQTADEEQSTIAATAAKRIIQAKGFGYLGYDISSPLLYLNSGELTRLMTSDAYWELFRPYFKGKKDVIKTKLDEVSIVRNSLAHFRPIKSDDVELIKQNIRHAFAGIEDCLSEMIETYQIVPTNTEADWYKNISPLGTKLCNLNLYQNKSEKWVRVELNYHCPILLSSAGQTYRSFNVMNLISPAIIKCYSELARHCTYVTEFPTSAMRSGGDPIFQKRVSIIFQKDSLLGHHQIIADQLKELFLNIETESELLEKDNLARGQLIESVRVFATLRGERPDSWWSFNKENLKCQPSDDSPPEYWGDVTIFGEDFIASTPRYPWMPSDISKEEFPF